MPIIKDIAFSLSNYAKGIALIRSLNLWRYFAIPLVISLVIAVLVFVGAWQAKTALSAYFTGIWPWAWGATAFAPLSGFIGSLGVLLLGFTLTKYLVLAFSAPFMSPVSERIDRHLNPGHAMNPSSSFWGLLSRSLRLNIGNLFRELGLTLMLLILGLFPVIGLISAPLIFVVQAFYAGFGNLDYTLERYYDYRSSKSFLHQYRGLAIGNGLVFILISLIPVLGIILVLPLSVSAGTFTVLETIKSGDFSNTKNHGHTNPNYSKS